MIEKDEKISLTLAYVGIFLLTLDGFNSFRYSDLIISWMMGI